MSFFQILPIETKFYDWFEKGALNVVESAELLQALLQDGDDWSGRVARLGELEHQGDFITHEIFDLLHKTFVTPFDPPEIEALARTIDDVIDFIYSAADSLLIYQVDSVHPHAGSLATIIVAATREIAAAIALLRDKKQLRNLLPHVLEIHRLENEADRLWRTAMSELVAQRSDMFELFRWKEIYQHLEDATDRCEDVADVLRTVVIKYA